MAVAGAEHIGAPGNELRPRFVIPEASAVTGVVGELGEAGLALRPRADTAPPPVMPYIGEAGLRPYQDAERIAADPAYGQIVCHCERVTLGEVRDALASVIPPADLHGLSRRTRVVNGRCQGFYCAAAVSRLLDPAVRL